MWFTKKIFHMKLGICIIKKQILHINDTNDVVLRFLIDRKTGKLIFTENIDQFFISIVYTGKGDMHLGNHDIFGIGISQIKYIVDHFLFIGFNHAILVADIYDCTKLFFSHCFIRSIRINMHDQHDHTGE